MSAPDLSPATRRDPRAERSRARRILRGPLLVALCAAALLRPAAAQEADPNAHTAERLTIPSVDGMPLIAWLYRPVDPPAETPVLLSVTPYAVDAATITEATVDVAFPPPLGSAN